jgi:hypothetical protein
LICTLLDKSDEPVTSSRRRLHTFFFAMKAR